ncbi:DHH family phosphoesterase [Croceicoccus mobilis]|uniref:Phosphohydrolase n=1 Tax=Croceicoccus mobilis TaxID=1703339 RepID=A0A916Z3B2_9SPHN|nr:DHH family phosphoesterase [Croceicoccus mobilis]GGD74013.1 hypothetical protein GCM10010990_24540 [Croceicoccus mobilis]
MWAPDIVVYHDKCMDGFTAAWACWVRWGDSCEYVARNYGMEPDIDVAGKNVLIVDFSFPAPVMADLVSVGRAASIVVLDHHKTARENLEPFATYKEKPERFTLKVVSAMIADLQKGGYTPIRALFDMDRSGAGMAWDFANEGGPRPMLVDLVEDRDLWRFDLGDSSKFLHLALTAGEANFERWTAINADIDGAIAQGMAIAAWRDRLVDEIVERATCVVIDGEYGIGVDCPYGLASDVGHRLLQDWPDACFAAAIVRGELTTSYSLRSTDDRADVSAIAAKFGGGGHRNAAGFKVPR